MALPLGGMRGYIPLADRSPPKPEQQEQQKQQEQQQDGAEALDGNGGVAAAAALHHHDGGGGEGGDGQESREDGASGAEGSGGGGDDDHMEEDVEGNVDEAEDGDGEGAGDEGQESDPGASALAAPLPRRAAAAAASSALATSTSGAAGGTPKASAGANPHFTITEGRAGPAAAPSSFSSSKARANAGGSGSGKTMKRSLHRACGLLDRAAFAAGSGSGGAPPFLQGSAALVDAGMEAYWQHHLHVQQMLQASRGAPHRRAPPPPAPPAADGWARLAFGGFSNALPGGHVLVEEPWVALGPSMAGPPPGKALLDLAAARAIGAREGEATLARRLGEVQGLLKQPGGAGAVGEELRSEALALTALGQQRELWARLLRWQAGRPLPGVAEYGYAALPEAVAVKQRVKRQSRADIKRFEREQRRRQAEREEGRRRRLRSYLQGVMAHREEFLRFHRQRRGEQRTCAQAVRKWFDSRDRRVEREKDNEERARLQALKDNDMDEYIRLVEKTRNERLNYLIQQTDAYIAKIADLVQSERAREGGIGADGGNEEEEVAEGGLGGEAADAGMSAKARGYYAITHRRTEEVAQPALLKGGALKEYQLAGLQWMVSLYNNKLSGILADEMGLGKTIQTISLICYVMEAKGNLGPFLIVVPLSTLSNWVNEFKKWAPEVLLVQFKGNPEERKQIFREEMEAGQFNVLLTTYELVMKDKALLGKRFEWEYIIVDEGHRMKNTESKFAQTLGSYYASKRRLLLTGTPLQNNLPELWSLLNFLLPSIFDSADSFDQWFNKPFASFGGGAGAIAGGGGGDKSEEAGAAQINEEEKMLIIQRLHELLRPFMLRRVKAAVMGQLPTKVEKVLKCELSGYQRRLYRDLASKALRARVPGISMNNVMMHLRKVCNHPYLFQDRYTVDEALVRASGKLELLDRLLPKLKAAGHRVLLFSQMTQMLDILEDYFAFRGFRHLRLDGQTSADDREERMYQFNAPDSPYFIFALSTRAGGLGLNLATADTVIFYDSDWNPSMDSQAMDRAHRIGQKNDVRVFRLITTTAVEEKIISRANEKAKITNLVVEAGKFNRDSKETERRAMVESLLREAGDLEGGGGGSGGEGAGAGEESNVPDDEQLNDMMATTQEELELYRRLDAERDAREAAAWAAHCTAEGLDPARHPQPPRLAAEVPLDSPDLAPLLAPDAGPQGGSGSGAEGGGNGNDTDEATILSHGRKRKEVSYTDNLTEKQFVRMMEKRAKEEEEEKEKRRAKVRAARGKSGLAPAVLDGMMAAYTAVRGLKDEADGRALAELFVEKPNKKLYPDYYEVIQTPIDLKTIRQRIKNGSYAALAQFQADFRLLFANAFTYNEEASLVCQDARRLRAVFEAEYAKLEALAKSLAPPPPPPGGWAAAAGGAGGAGGKGKKARKDGAGGGGDGYSALAGLYDGSGTSVDG